MAQTVGMPPNRLPRGPITPMIPFMQQQGAPQNQQGASQNPEIQRVTPQSGPGMLSRVGKSLFRHPDGSLNIRSIAPLVTTMLGGAIGHLGNKGFGAGAQAGIALGAGFSKGIGDSQERLDTLAAEKARLALEERRVAASALRLTKDHEYKSVTRFYALLDRFNKFIKEGKSEERAKIAHEALMGHINKNPALSHYQSMAEKLIEKPIYDQIKISANRNDFDETINDLRSASVENSYPVYLHRLKLATRLLGKDFKNYSTEADKFYLQAIVESSRQGMDRINKKDGRSKYLQYVEDLKEHDFTGGAHSHFEALLGTEDESSTGGLSKREKSNLLSLARNNDKRHAIKGIQSVLLMVKDDGTAANRDLIEDAFEDFFGKMGITGISHKDMANLIIDGNNFKAFTQLSKAINPRDFINPHTNDMDYEAYVKAVRGVHEAFGVQTKDVLGLLKHQFPTDGELDDIQLSKLENLVTNPEFTPSGNDADDQENIDQLKYIESVLALNRIRSSEESIKIPKELMEALYKKMDLFGITPSFSRNSNALDDQITNTVNPSVSNTASNNTASNISDMSLLHQKTGSSNGMRRFGTRGRMAPGNHQRQEKGLNEGAQGKLSSRPPNIPEELWETFPDEVKNQILKGSLVYDPVKKAVSVSGG